MHGRVKVRTSEEEKKKKDKERAQKVVIYQSCMQKISLKRENNALDREILEMISQILLSNPDIYTLWNIRRECCLALSNRDEEKINLSKLYDSELNLTENCLKINPKSYGAWHHRVWVLDVRADADWKKEIDLCNYYLKIDERNFHCWDYRRHIVSRANVSLHEEFNFTTKKIKDNFSNYSAWHYRSKLLIKLFPDVRGEIPIEEKNHRYELEMVLNAAFTDPNDTSAWFYQRWLLGGIKNNIRLSTCRISANESLVCFSHNVKETFIRENVRIVWNDGEIDGAWKSVKDSTADVAWVLKHKTELHISGDSSLSVILRLGSTNVQNLQCLPRGAYYIGIPKPEFRPKYGPTIMDELDKQLKYCYQLLEFEPDSKWTLLTTVVIMCALDAFKYYGDILENLKKLKTVDGLRSGYYNDLESKLITEQYLMENIDVLRYSEEFTGLPNKYSGFPLHSLYHFQYWSACSIVNLSNHKLTNRSLPLLAMLQYCKELDISGNKITTLKGFPKLPKLEVIKLDRNIIDFSELHHLGICTNIYTVYLKIGQNTEGYSDIENNLLYDILPKLSSIKIL